MKKINIFSILFTLLLLSCWSLSAQKKFVASVTSQDATYIIIDDNDSIKNFLNSSSSQIVDVVTNLVLHTKSSEAWCKPSLVENNKVAITTDANTGENTRTANVTIYGKDNKSAIVKVIQLGAKPAILVNEKNFDFDQFTSVFSIGVTSSINFSFELPSWVKGPSINPSIGFNNYEFTLDPIGDNDVKEGEIIIKAENNIVAEVKIPIKQTHVGYPTFAVISDVHFGNSKGEGPMVKVPKALKNLTSHKKLDALFIVGDLTESGATSQYSQFVQVMSNKANFTNPVDTMIYMLGNHDNYASQDNYTNGLKPLNNNKAYPFDQYIVIKGYPFITISQRNSSNTDASNEANGTGAYPKAVQDTLRKWLERAETECPGKPIFVFTHVPTKFTCYSSWPGEGDGTSWPTWSMKVLNPILNDYPQAVVFGGHSHFPIGDPRSIHQGVNPNSSKKNFYTGINTGSTTYSEIHKPSVNAGIHPEKYDYVTEGMILTVQPNGDVKIQRYDTYRNEEMHPEKPWVLKAPHDGSMFEYADIRDAADNVNNLPLRDGLPAPVFAGDAAITLSTPTTNSIKVTYPQATDDEYVFRYLINIKNEEGKVVKEFYQFSQFYLNSQMPNTLTATMDGLMPNTTYTAEVIAYDSYDNTSTALVSQPFTTADDNDPANQPPPRTGSWLFNDENDLLKATAGEALVPATETTSGGVTVKNSAAEANIVSIAGPSAANKAIRVPKLSLLKLVHGINSTVGTYTIMYDVRVSSTTNYHCLLQTSLANSGDGDVFINKSAQLGLSVSEWGYGGTVTSNTWHRIVLVVTDGIPNIYLNGSSVKAGTGANDRWRLAADGTLLFADDSGEDDDIDVAEIGFWDKALTSSQITNLGIIK